MPLRAKYEREKGRVDEIRTVQNKLDELRIKMLTAERNRDLAAVADLKYYAIPELEAKLRALETQERERELSMDVDDGGEERMLTENVGPEQIYEVVSAWTGIPVARYVVVTYAVFDVFCCN